MMGKRSKKNNNNLDDTIKDIDTIAAAYKKNNQAERWLKVSELLRELKAYRETGYTPGQIRKLQAENAKLKQQMQEDEESFCCMP